MVDQYQPVIRVGLIRDELDATSRPDDVDLFVPRWLSGSGYELTQMVQLINQWLEDS